MKETLMNELREILGAQTSDGAAVLEPLLHELWTSRERDTLPANVRFAAAEALGAKFLEAGTPPSSAVRLVLTAGRSLVEVAEGRKHVDGAGARRLGALVDEAAAQVAAAIEHARGQKRQQWLSYLVHELKNPLNTVLNALWLLREKGSDPKQSARFLDLAERAVRRLEARTKDVRELDEQLVNPPPGWEATHPRPPSP